MVKRDAHVKSEDAYHICMPRYFNFTCAVVGNNVYSGLLHAYIRHYPELEAQIPSLSALRANLPAKMQAAMKGITLAFNMAAAKSEIADFLKSFNESGKARSVLHKVQMLVLRYFESVLTANQVPQAAFNTCGKYQLRYAVKKNMELVVGPTDPKAPIQSFGDKRPARFGDTLYAAEHCYG
uniref:Cytochrome P450 n=1 Tax=Panagrellus redivivus TaxID=6233 RepID=A0A7E4UQA9_PANRE